MTSNVEGELRLREARLEFRGSKKEDSEGEKEEGSGCSIVGSKVSALRRQRAREKLEGSHNV